MGMQRHARQCLREAKMLTMRCYCCGNAIGDEVALVTMSADIDRVFVMLPECAPKADAAFEIVKRQSTDKGAVTPTACDFKGDPVERLDGTFECPQCGIDWWNHAAISAARRAAQRAATPTAETNKEVPKGHFWRGLRNPEICRNCSYLHSAHIHTDEASWCPLNTLGAQK